MEGSVTKWPSTVSLNWSMAGTVSLNWSMAGTTTSTGRSSLVRLAMDRIRSKSRVLDSCTAEAISERFLRSSCGCSSRSIPHNLHLRRLVLRLEPVLSVTPCKHVD